MHSFIGGALGNEEKHGRLPLAPNEIYTAAIICQEDGYEIAIKGIHFTHYEYRIQPQDINTMTVKVNPPAIFETK